MQQDATRNPSTLLIAFAVALMLIILVVTFFMPSNLNLFDEYGDDALGMSGIREQFDVNLLQVPAEALHRHQAQKDSIPALVTEAARARRAFAEHETDGANPPRVMSIQDVAELESDLPMLAVTVGDQTRVYPVSLLRWHICINDVLGDVPIAVVHDPISRTSTVFDRRIGREDRPLEFGVSGVLLYDVMLLYDRHSNGLWMPISQSAISGQYVGHTAIGLVDWEVGSLAQMQQTYPDATILSLRETGHDFPYLHPSTLADNAGDVPMTYIPGMDQRLPPREQVIGVAFNGEAVVYPLEVVNMRRDGTIQDQLAGYPVEIRANTSENGQWHIDLIQLPAGARVAATDWYAWSIATQDSRIYPDEE